MNFIVCKLYLNKKNCPCYLPSQIAACDFSAPLSDTMGRRTKCQMLFWALHAVWLNLPKWLCWPLFAFKEEETEVWDTGWLLSSSQSVVHTQLSMTSPKHFPYLPPLSAIEAEHLTLLPCLSTVHLFLSSLPPRFLLYLFPTLPTPPLSYIRMPSYFASLFQEPINLSSKLISLVCPVLGYHSIVVKSDSDHL